MTTPSKALDELKMYLRHAARCKIYDRTCYAPYCTCGMDSCLKEVEKELEGFKL